MSYQLLTQKYTLPQDIIDLFQVTFQFDINAYFDAFYYFLVYQYPNIQSFYTGNLETIDPANFAALNSLIAISTNMMNLLRENKEDFTTYEHWDFIDYVTDMNEKLLTIQKIYKFLRSSKVKTNFSSELKFNYNIGQNESLEQISRKQLSSTNPDNDWIDIATENNLREIDYSDQSGNAIVLSIKLNAQSLGVKSVVDSVEGIRVLGLDLNRITTFTNNDLDVKQYVDTFKQSVGILLSLLKEDIPEFPDMGRTPNIGTNVNIFAFNSNVRELAETISSDDSIVGFTILNITNDFASGQVFINCSLRSRLDSISTTQTLNT